MNTQPFEPLRAVAAYDLGHLAEERADRVRRAAAYAARLPAESVARALPDSLFADDADVARLVADANTKSLRAKRVAGGASLRGSIVARIDQIQAKQVEALAEMRLAALDDVFAGDLEFSLATAVALRVDELRRKLDGAQMALQVLTKSPFELQEFPDAAAKAISVLSEALLELKRGHVRAHPELMHKDPATAPG